MLLASFEVAECLVQFAESKSDAEVDGTNTTSKQPKLEFEIFNPRHNKKHKKYYNDGNRLIKLLLCVQCVENKTLPIRRAASHRKDLLGHTRPRCSQETGSSVDFC
jgi:hypothetical protein